jgi:hypothetical protein
MLPETLVGKVLPGGIGESTFGGIGVGLKGGARGEERGARESEAKISPVMRVAGGEERGCGAVGDPSPLFKGAVSSGPGGPGLILSHESDALESFECSSPVKSGAGAPARERRGGDLEIHEGAPILFVCAWCEAERGNQQKVAKDAKPVSHGICKRHLAVMRAELAAQDWRHR